MWRTLEPLGLLVSNRLSAMGEREVTLNKDLYDRVAALLECTQLTRY